MVTWQCIIHGRPPLLTQRHIDIQLPDEETEATMGADPTCTASNKTLASTKPKPF